MSMKGMCLFAKDLQLILQKMNFMSMMELSIEAKLGLERQIEVSMKVKTSSIKVEFEH